MTAPAIDLPAGRARRGGDGRLRRWWAPRRTRALVVGLALLAAGLAGAAVAQGAVTPVAARASQQGPAVALLRRMLTAAQTLEVVGTTTERIDLPGVRPDPAHQRFVLPVAAAPEQVAKAFSLRLGAPTEVAGRRVQVLELHGLDPLVPDWTFWVDGVTGARLAYRVTDSAGHVVAEGRYDRVTAVRARTTPRALPSPGATLEAKRLQRLLDPANVPAGYVPVGATRTKIGRAGIPALRVTFFDGLDALVLLVYRRQAALPAGAGQRLASRRVGRFTLSAVGPAPKAALQAWLDRLSRGPLARPGSARTVQELAAP